MGQTDGFIKYSRTLPARESVEDRIKHYNDFHQRFEADELNHQAARCMNCGVPFCHSGCPLGNDIPDFNDAVYRKDWKQAYELLNSTNNFPEFTGRICPAPCESACVLGINQPAITIEEIEKHIIEIAFEKGFVKPKKPSFRTNKKVAIIGSGPAGLAAAAQLNYAGHNVTVFERDDEPGGLLMYGIPDFKLEKSVVRRRIDLLKEEGITFKCHSHVGKNVRIDDLLRNFNAIVIATGSTKPRDLSLNGRDLKGIHFAMEYLKQQNKINEHKDPFAHAEIESNIATQRIDAKGKKVVVIGGGDTGSDCVGTAIRQGASSVLQITHGPIPSKERNPYNTWPAVANTFSTSSSQEEGCERKWNLAPHQFLGDEKGNISALVVKELAWKLDEKETRIGSEEINQHTLDCDLVLLAAGFIHPEQEGLLSQLEIDLDNRGNIHADNKHFTTNINKIFACGDARKGQSLVVWAISEGRECATQVDAFLSNGKTELESKNRNVVIANESTIYPS